MTDPEMIAPGAGEALWFLDTLMQVKASGEATGGALAVFEQLAPPGSATPMHRHDETHEHFYVLDGELTFHGPAGARACGRGTFVSVPPGTPHAFRVTSAGPARLLVLSAPATFERFVRAVGAPAPGATLPPAGPPPPEVLERIASAGSRHDVTLLGPPPAA